ncbi:hypothetical protein HF295_04640 [Hujiaoplasma nucleasis]|uniref:DUF559 domain-containing protein n=1 Tax=Hujiaoplasma nucleasis TaxID=2725268 RepID=A0A7L6N4H9_9MOLU|nr:hypothetical protein [Hujiaoplasma nucleasis]QLY40187.1 hypothetical protein HF295_04640 [Hujiaoplasma nucleasis]
MIDKKTYSIALQDIRKQLSNSGNLIDEKYNQIYDSFPNEIRDILAILHSKLDSLISFLSYKGRTHNMYNPDTESIHYNAHESRELIFIISIIHKLKQISNVNQTFVINQTYIDFIEFMDPQLCESGGSKITGYQKPFKTVDYEPIFKLDKSFKHGNIKNIIFASTLKPEIVLEDALENNIQIVKNEKYSLIYDRHIDNSSLSINDLINWWKDKSEEKLFPRLIESIKGNEVEIKLFDIYYKQIVKNDFDLPALLPQVYLHYDPKTIKELFGEKRLIHQRMDFLMLYAGRRIIIEIDGVQHYSEGGKPSPKKYAEMVGYDRKMKLHGYEIYRFGGHEFIDSDIDNVIEDFFKNLIKKVND